MLFKEEFKQCVEKLNSAIIAVVAAAQRKPLSSSLSVFFFSSSFLFFFRLTVAVITMQYLSDELESKTIGRIQSLLFS